MTESISGAQPMFGGAFRGLAWLGGLVATVAAMVIGAALAVFFAATLAVIAVMGGIVLSLFGVALRAKRTVQSKDSTVIEAHNVGGHWVAYGWDQNGR